MIQPDLEYGSTAFSSSLSTSGKDHLLQASKKGLCGIVRAPPWTPTAPILQFLHLVSIAKRYDLMLLLTSRCIQSIASSLLCHQLNLGLPSNGTDCTTRSQAFHTLYIPLLIVDPVHSPPPPFTPVHYYGTISPLTFVLLISPFLNLAVHY